MWHPGYSGCVSQSVFVTSPEPLTGKSAVAFGMLESLAARSERVGVFRPITNANADRDPAVELLLTHPAVDQNYDDAFAVTTDEILADPDSAQQKILARFHELAEKFSMIVVLGTDWDAINNPVELQYNAEVAANIGSPVVMVTSAHGRSPYEVANLASVSYQEFADNQATPVAVIVSRGDAAEIPAIKEALADRLPEGVLIDAMPEDPLLMSPTVADLQQAVNGTLIAGNPDRLNRVSTGTVTAGMGLPEVLRRLSENCTVVAPGDRPELLPALMLAQQSGTYPNLASVILTGDYAMVPEVALLLEGRPDDLPVITSPMDTFGATVAVSQARGYITAECPQKLDGARRVFADNIDVEKLLNHIHVNPAEVVTPMMFEHQLQAQARGERKTIVLPEGNEPRILAATEAILNRGVANIVLLGDETEIQALAAQLGHDISQASVVSPHDPTLVEKYAEEYARLRAKKGVTLEEAREKVQDVSYFGTMMVHMGEADGMVSGAVHSTAHTIRPSFEIIKTKPGAKIVSSVFLMSLKDRVLVYGDCAVNPDPTSEQLADIAAQSAATAQQFGVDPLVAMLSYSTGNSGSGADVDKVREATEMVRAAHPELKVEGPIQYDAAVDASVAKTKLPDSAVAGRASVFIFPDLNTGNNTYKAVQRSAGAVAIGPVLQGLNKPVNDLSRGALVEDIINTVVITAIQAQAQG